MKDNGWNVSVQWYGSDQPRIIVSVSPKYANHLIERHANVTNFILDKVKSAVSFVEEQTEERQAR
jgi:hypothetical protein